MKFSVGEIAIVAVRCDWPEQPKLGDEVEIVRIGISRGMSVSGANCPRFDGVCRRPADYEVRDARGWHWFCDKHHLRKRPQPGIPLSTLRIFSEPQDNPDKARETA